MRTDLKKARNGVIAAALGAALLMGGGTYALWTTSANLDGGSIQAGEMSINPVGDPTTYDISADRANLTDTNDPVIIEGVTIANSGALVTDDFRMVPGDTVALAFAYDILLVGDNLKAKLSLGGFDATFLSGFSYLTLGYAVYDSATNEAIVPQTALTPAADIQLATLTPDESGTVVFVLYATFAVGTPDVEDMNAILTLTDAVSLTLTQDRAVA